MSLYKDYQSELEQKPVIETETGFIQYGFHGTDCYIENVYVKPEFRRTKEGSKLLNLVIDDAKSKRCLRLFGSVVPNRNGATTSLKIQLALGFCLFSASENFVLLMKEIKYE